jgi:flagellar basal-body rod modification protein FlgD
MEIPGIDTATVPPQGRTKTVLDIGETFDQFLTLLTAQLRYQDPLSPMDSTEFTSQLVQFASVEQSIRINDQLETLIEMQRNDASATALGYIGRTVEVPGNVVTLEGGRAEIAYLLDENAGTTAISIIDSAGQLVLAADGETVAGKHHFVWNGTSNTGVELPDGEYRVSVGAVDLTGVPMSPATFVLGRVTSVEIDESGALLSLGVLKVSLDKVTAIHETPRPSANDGQG